MSFENRPKGGAAIFTPFATHGSKTKKASLLAEDPLLTHSPFPRTGCTRRTYRRKERPMPSTTGTVPPATKQTHDRAGRPDRTAGRVGQRVNASASICSIMGVGCGNTNSATSGMYHTYGRGNQEKLGWDRQDGGVTSCCWRGVNGLKQRRPRAVHPSERAGGPRTTPPGRIDYTVHIWLLVATGTVHTAKFLRVPTPLSF